MKAVCRGDTAREWAWIVALLLVAFWFRTVRLADVPPGLHHDDIKNVILVEKIMAGDIRIYYEENYGHEPLYHWLQALYFALVGSGYPELRLLSAGISMVGLATVYALAKRLLGQNVALWTLAWQVVSLWPLFYSRRAIRGVLLPPLAALTGYLFIAGADGKRRPDWLGRWGTWVLGGVSLSACLYTYMGARVLPVFFILFTLYLALAQRARVKACWRGIAAFFVVALVLSLPLGIYLASHPEERMSQINMPLNAIRRGEWQPLWENSARALSMFSFLGDPHWRQFVADTPVFEPLGAILFYAGIAASLWHWRKPEYVFSLLWLPVTLSPAMLSEGAPNFLRPIAAQTAAYLFPALATVLLIEWLERRAHRRLAWVAVGGAIVLLAFNGWRTFDGYFVRWPRHPDVRFAYSSTLLEESRYLDASAGLDSVVLSGHFPADLDPGLVDRFSRRRDLAVRWCDIRQSLVYPDGGSTTVIEPDYFAIDPVLRERFMGDPAPLTESRLPDGTLVYAAYPLGTDGLEHLLAEAGDRPVGWSRAASFPDGLPEDWASLDGAVVFGGRVALIGYEVLNGERVAPGDVVTLITLWRVVQPGPTAGITFVHLLSPEGAVVSGYDGFGAPPNRWVSGDVVVQIHRFGLPGDLQPGALPIELGWYERDTGARWPVSTADGDHADRLLLQPLIIAGEGDR